MFTRDERQDLLDQLVAVARGDGQVEAAALVGSAARDGEDLWSDIDLALRIAADQAPERVAGQWTQLMYQQHQAVAHLDVWSGSTLFRVFLLRSSLQIDVSFWRSDTFAQSGGPFRLLFGEANEPVAPSMSDPAAVLGMGWLYALHVRSSIARGRHLQAVFMINGMRDQVVFLACLRNSLPAHDGRGADDLPRDVRQLIADAIPRALDQPELIRTFGAATDALLFEARQLDPAQASALEEPLRELVRTSAGDLA